MVNFNLLIQSFLLGAATAASSSGQGGWKNGPKATGAKDPNVTTNCDYWVNNVQPGDTCKMVEDYFGITETQFQSWNPELKSSAQCKMVPGFSYCVSGPAGAASSAAASATPASTVTYSGIAAPVQTGLAKSCTKYHLVQNGDTCNSIQNQYMDFTLKQFYAWNPSIREGCNGLVDGDYVCVGAKGSASSTSLPSSTSSAFPTQTGVFQNCNKWHFVTGDDDCDSIRAKYGLTPERFYKWNPATGEKCTKLWRKTNVCVGVPGFTPSPSATTAAPTGGTTAPTSSSTGSVPSPVQSGIASDCKKYYKVKDGDTCVSVEKDHNISVDDFNKWNPAVGTDCSDLEKNAYVCIAV